MCCGQRQVVETGDTCPQGYYLSPLEHKSIEIDVTHQFLKQFKSPFPNARVYFFCQKGNFEKLQLGIKNLCRIGYLS
jgi:hypothetical protein